MLAPWLLLTTSVAALDVSRESYKILGWGSYCTVAVERLAFPVLGQAILDEPITSRVGTLSLEPGEEEPATLWHWEADGRNTWDKLAVAKIERELLKADYNRPGFTELLRDAPVGAGGGVSEMLLSTGTLRARLKAWPGPEWRWAAAYYSPLSTCALLVFEKRGERERYLMRLARIDNARARVDRALAHAANAHLLFDAGDVEGSLAEAAIAARQAPEQAPARYHHARILALTGRLDESVKEFAAALKLDARSRDKARRERDFEALRPRQDFRALLGGH